MPCHRLASCGDQMLLHIWPQRSFPRRGFVWFIGLTAARAAVPVLGHLGPPVLWFLLPFVTLTLTAVWLTLRRSHRDGEILEVLRRTPSERHLTRDGPGQRRNLAANRRWVRLTLHAVGGPVPDKLTLPGGGREVEPGAFLSEAARISLYRDLPGKTLQPTPTAP